MARHRRHARPSHMHQNASPSHVSRACSVTAQEMCGRRRVHQAEAQTASHRTEGLPPPPPPLLQRAFSHLAGIPHEMHQQRHQVQATDGEPHRPCSQPGITSEFLHAHSSGECAEKCSSHTARPPRQWQSQWENTRSEKNSTYEAQPDRNASQIMLSDMT